MAVVNVKVANIRPMFDNLRDWMLDENNVYIGRKGIVFVDGKRFPKEDSYWANPYKVGKDGTREQVLQKYKDHIENKSNTDPTFNQRLQGLVGKNLGCWCKPEPCHGDWLLSLVKQLK